MGNVFIVGAGSIGTALAQLCSNIETMFSSGGRNQADNDSINMDRLNCDYFRSSSLEQDYCYKLV